MTDYLGNKLTRRQLNLRSESHIFRLKEDQNLIIYCTNWISSPIIIIIIYAFAKCYQNSLVLRQKIIWPQRLLLPIHWWRQVLKNDPNVNFYNSSGANRIIPMAMITKMECFKNILIRNFDLQFLHLICYVSYNCPLLK